jgi:O-antigen/teichoic acid export membrane protein
MDSVARAASINLLARIGSVLAVLGVVALTARISPAAQGTFALFTSIEGILLALCSGLGVALARVPATLPGPERGAPGPARAGADAGLDARRGAALGCLLLGAAAAPLLWALDLRGGPGYEHVALLALAAPLLLLTPNLSGWWLGQGRMRPLALATLAPPLLALLAVAVQVALGRASLHGVLLAWVAAKLLVGAGLAVALLVAAPAGAPWSASAWLAAWLAAWGRAWRWLRGQAGFVLTIAGTNLVGLLNYRVGLFVIERQLGLAATGVYSIAVVVAELLWFVSSALTQAVYGRLGLQDRAAAAALTLRVLQLSLLALVTLATPLALLARWALPGLLGPGYEGVAALLVLLLPGVVLFGGASALSAWFTQHCGQPQVPAQVAALSLLLNLGLCMLGVPAFGAAGAAIAASLAYATSMALLAWRFVRSAGLPVSALWRAGPQLGADLALLWRSIASLGRR